MRSNLPFILHRRDVCLDMAGTEVTLKWTEWPAGTPVDGVTQSKVADANHQPTEVTLVVKATIHFLTPASMNAVRQHNECEVGDAIVNLPWDAALDKEDLRVEIAGVDWVQKSISDKLVQSWEGIVRGEKFNRTMLLRKAT